MANQLRTWFFQVTKTALKRGTRFRTDDRPTQGTFLNLVNSIIFKTESDDRAKLDTGSFSDTTVGHVVLATDTQSRTNAAQATNRSLVVQPHQTTTLSDGSDETIEDFTGKSVTVTLDGSITTRKNYLLRLSDGFKTWLLTRLIPSGGTTGQVLSKTNGSDYNTSWTSIISNLDWSENLTTTSPVVATLDKGYTAEGGVVSVLDLPISPLPANNKRVGVSADNNSSVNIRLEGSVDTFFSISAEQSVIFRFDSTKASWLVENSYLPADSISSGTIYVDGFAVAGGVGSVTFPFNTIEDARDFVIGSGTKEAPEFTDMQIRVLSGEFFISDENLWVNTLSYSFEDGVVVNIDSSLATLGTPFYLFENTVNAFSTTFAITGKCNFIINNPYCGLFRAKGTTQTATSSSAANNTINAIFGDCNISYSHTTAAVSLVYADCTTEENGGRTMITIDCQSLIGANTEGVVYIGQGGSCLIQNCTIGSHFDTNNRSKLSVKIDNCYIARFTNCYIGAPGESKHIYITGTCDAVSFDTCKFYVYDGSNSSLYNNNIIKLDSTFDRLNKFSSNKSYGFFIKNCYTDINNLNAANNLDSVYGYFCFKRDVGDTTFVSFTVDLNNNEFFGRMSTYVNGYFTNNIGPSYGLVQSFRRNVYAFDSTFAKTIVYSGLPTSSSGLSSGMLWSNAGVITMV